MSKGIIHHSQTHKFKELERRIFHPRQASTFLGLVTIPLDRIPFGYRQFQGAALASGCIRGITGQFWDLGGVGKCSSSQKLPAARREVSFSCHCYTLSGQKISFWRPKRRWHLHSPHSSEPLPLMFLSPPHLQPWHFVGGKWAGYSLPSFILVLPLLLSSSVSSLRFWSA